MRTTFFTSSNKAYEPFVLPYVTSVLIHNDDANVEICLEDAAEFSSRNQTAVNLLNKSFSGRFRFRDAEFRNVEPGNVRFVETPSSLTEFTYIGDIDILILEPVTGIHLERMKASGLPYSNVERPGSKRLTGLHFTRSDAYYPIHLPEGVDLAVLQDEELLHKLVKSRGLCMAPVSSGMAEGPLHGFHFRIQRLPNDHEGGWGLERKYIPSYSRLQSNPIWRDLSPYFDSSYRLLLMTADVALSSAFPADMADFKSAPATSIRELFFEVGDSLPNDLVDGADAQTQLRHLRARCRDLSVRLHRQRQQLIANVARTRNPKKSLDRAKREITHLKSRPADRTIESKGPVPRRSERSGSFGTLAASAAKRLRRLMRRVLPMLGSRDSDTDITRWSDLRNFRVGWDERTKMIAAMVPAGSSVFEFGAGRQILRQFLPSDCRYTPSDLVERGPGTFICDLNAKKLPPFPAHDVAVFSGVLEYVLDIDRLVANLANAFPCVIATYCPVSSPPTDGMKAVRRNKNGFVNHFLEVELVAIFRRNGYDLTRRTLWKNQMIGVFERSKV